MAPHFEVPGIGKIEGTEHKENDATEHATAMCVVAQTEDSIVVDSAVEVADEDGGPCDETIIADQLRP